MDSVFIDQNLGSGGWVTLMNDVLPADSGITLLVTDAMSPVVSGLVLRADAVRFQWLQEGTEAVGGSLADIPTRFELLQNYPNPLNPVTEIRYAIPGARGQRLGTSLVRLVVYDLVGREVATLVNEVKQPGTYTVTWDASGVATGVYFYRLSSGQFIQTRKLIVLR
jgi:hypothetical protein